MDFDMFLEVLIFEPKWGVCMGYSLCMMADFQNALISGIFRVFWAVFCTEQLWMICTMDFDLFLWVLFFKPKWGFFMGYSICMMVAFQNAFISGIFLVFWSGFLHRTTLNDFYNGFWHVFWNFNFWAKMTIFHGF